MEIALDKFINNQLYEYIKPNQFLEYKGYKGSIERLEDGTYWGKVINKPNESIIYEGNTIEELKEDFHEMVDF